MNTRITNECTGCRMCEQICPVKGISMRETEEGFLEAAIDETKCVKCDLCKNRCPQNTVKKKNKNKSVYAVRLKDDMAIMRSASGGAFVAIAQYVLRQNGVVFGAAYTDNLAVEHISIRSIDELYKLQGSKYVQSNTKATFFECKKELECKKLVLYTGTPCQIAGLKAYLGKDY